MAKSKRRNTESTRKALRRSQRYLDGGGESNYARKRKYCLRHGVWGWEVPYPKPWRKAS